MAYVNEFLLIQNYLLIIAGDLLLLRKLTIHKINKLLLLISHSVSKPV